MRVRLVAWVGCCWIAGTAYGQIQRFVPPVNPLPAASTAVLKRLDGLGALGGANWEWHPGDLPHGEDPVQDDGRWKPLKDRADAGKGPFWFRTSFKVPQDSHGYDLTGAALILSLRVSPSGTVPEILYLNGRRIALGTDLEPEVLESSLRPGEKIEVAVKLLATADAKTIRRPDLRLRFAPARPEPTHLREECESAAVLLPTLDTDPNLLTADLKVLEEAIAAVDFGALDHARQADFDASLRKAESMLEPLRAKLGTLSVAAIGNSHIDAAWRWPWTETVEAVKNTWTSALQLAAEYPDFKYTQADLQYNAWMEHRYPAIEQAAEESARQGRWDLVGGMWAEPDLNEPDGESMTRQILIGKRYAKQHFGVDVKIGWNVDSFGYSWQLPQVYKKSGIDYFVTQKMNWNEANRLPLKLFWWQSPDGSSVLTYFPMSYYGTTDPVQMAQELANARPLNPGLKTVMHVYGVGDHGGGPTRVELDAAEKWMHTRPVYPALTLSTPTEFFASVAPKVSAPAVSPAWTYKTLMAGKPTLAPTSGDGISVPVWRDELYLEFHRGTYTTQAVQKKNMRDSEVWLLDAEKLSSIAWAQAGLTYPQDALNEAWKKVLFNTNHDLAAGSGIGSIYADAQVDYDAVHATTTQASGNASAWMSGQADTRGKDPAHEAAVFVVNTLAWPREGIFTASVQMPSGGDGKDLRVEDAEGRPVPAQVLAADKLTGTYKLLLKPNAVPAMGFAVLHVVHGKGDAASDLHADATTLENSLLKVTLDPKTGCITHLITKSSGFDSIAAGGCGNQLQTFTDTPKQYDAWNIDSGALTTMQPIDSVDSIDVLDRGPLRASIRIKRHWGKSTFEQTLVLYAGVGRVDVENTIDWRETHVLLKAAMPLRASSDAANYEIPYGVIARPTTRDNSIEQAQFEVPALRWADLGDAQHGLSLINNSKYGYDATAHLLRLSLLRSPVYPDPVADRGEQHVTYSLYPHDGTWQQAMTERRGYEFNYPLAGWQVPQHEGTLGRQHSFFEVKDPSIVLTAMKKSEDGHAIILRAYDWSGKDSKAEILLPGIPAAAFEADMMEQSSGPKLLLTGAVLKVTMHPFEIKTIRVEYSAEADTK